MRDQHVAEGAPASVQWARESIPVEGGGPQ